MRVADRGDRDRRPRRDEERAQQLELRLGGVLELVEEHRPEPSALGDAHLLDLGGDPGGEGHLVGEVHGVARPLELLVALEDGDDRRALAQDADDVAHRVGALAGALALRDGLEGGDDGVEVRGEGRRADEVLGQLSREVDDRGGHGGLGLVDLVHRPVPRDDGLVGELPRGGLGEQPALGLDADPQPVLAHDPSGVRVVGRDGGDVVEDDRAVLLGR